MSRPPELVMDSVGVRVGKKELLRDVSLSLAPGDRLVLVGPNGAGKTTLLRAALGLVAPASGRVTVHGEDVRSLPPKARAKFLGWLPQHRAISEPIVVVDVVTSARYRFTESRLASERAALAALERVDAAGLAGARVTELSGGERQRVAIATLLAQEPELLLLDEPASHLDPAQQLELYRLIGDLAGQGLGVLVVTHDVNLVGQLGAADRVTVVGLDRGRTVFRARFDDLELPAQLGALFGMRFTAVEHHGHRLLFPEPTSSRS